MNPHKFDTVNKNSEIKYYYENSESEFSTSIKTKFKLEKLVADCKDSIEKVVAITKWGHNLWEHDGGNEPKKYDPIFIIEEAQKGKQFRCVEYSIVTSACLNSLGIKSRIVSLKTKDVETRKFGAGHVVVEAFIKEQNKWLFVDPQFNFIATKQNHQVFNCIEFQELLCNKNPEIIPQSEITHNLKEYYSWIYPYLFYFDVAFDNRQIENKIKFDGKNRLMLVPLNAKFPTKFQINYNIDYCYYSNCIKDFYNFL